MKLVVDTNIFVSFFRQNPVNEIITKSRLFNLKLYSPQYAIEELKNIKKAVLRYSKLDSKQFNDKLSELLKTIRIVPEEVFNEFKSEAKQLAPHNKDAPFFALALFLNSAIWSNEPAFKEQEKVIILSTKDVIELVL